RPYSSGATKAWQRCRRCRTPELWRELKAFARWWLAASPALRNDRALTRVDGRWHAGFAQLSSMCTSQERLVSLPTSIAVRDRAARSAHAKYRELGLGTF